MPRAATAPPRRQHGFTLTELFATIAVAAVLAAVALPNLQEFIKNNARSARINTLVTALNYARSDAVSHRRTTLVCASTDNSTCADTNEFLKGGNGILVRTDPSGSDELLRTFGTDSSTANVTLAGFESGGTELKSVSFGPDGRATGSVANARFVYCDDRGAAEARAVLLSPTGHPRVSSTLPNGDPLTC